MSYARVLWQHAICSHVTQRIGLLLSCVLVMSVGVPAQNTTTTTHAVPALTRASPPTIAARKQEYLQEIVQVQTPLLNEKMTTKVNLKTETRDVVLRVDPPGPQYELISATPFMNQTRGAKRRVEVKKDKSEGQSYVYIVRLIEPDKVEKDVHVDLQLTATYRLSDSEAQRRAENDVASIVPSSIPAIEPTAESAPAPLVKAQMEPQSGVERTEGEIQDGRGWIQIIGIIAILVFSAFLMVLVIAAVRGKSVPQGSRPLIVILMATCLAIGLGPSIASAEFSGDLPLLNSGASPIAVAGGGALATWVICMVVGMMCYAKPRRRRSFSSN